MVDIPRSKSNTEDIIKLGLGFPDRSEIIRKVLMRHYSTEWGRGKGRTGEGVRERGGGRKEKGSRGKREQVGRERGGKHKGDRKVRGEEEVGGGRGQRVRKARWEKRRF